nr:hypothetical protein GCM10020092_041930 [Actinoplanes digitatis]
MSRSHWSVPGCAAGRTRGTPSPPVRAGWSPSPSRTRGAARPSRPSSASPRTGSSRTGRNWLGAGRLADAAVVATQDRLHRDPAVRLADLGYHLLLEKPMAPTEAEAADIAAAALRNGVIVAVCHVLRYTPYTRLLRRVLDEGRIGRLVNVQHLEPVGWWHQAHSFVRGNWSSTEESGPMLLTKSCHDIDWLVHLFGAIPERVSSFGGLTHFRAEHRPEGAAERCLDCRVEAACPYSAKRLYLAALADPARHFWPLGAVTEEATGPAVLHALRTGPYGRCVYGAGNDVVDHQEVSMAFPDGATCSFTMSAFTPAEHRRTRLMGTHGYLDGDGVRLRYVDFRTGAEEVLEVAAGDPSAAERARRRRPGPDRGVPGRGRGRATRR